MKKLGKNKLFKNYISLFIPLFSIEILFRILSNMPILDWAVFRLFIGCNIISLLIGIVTVFLKNKAGNILTGIVLLIATIYAILQAGFENYIGVYVSLGTSSQLGAVTEYIKDYFDSFNPLFYTMAIPFGIFILYKWLGEKHLFQS